MFLKPDYNLKRIYDINLEELKDNGIKAMLFDLDSTLMASKSGYYSDEMRKWLLRQTQEPLSLVRQFFQALVTKDSIRSFRHPLDIEALVLFLIGLYFPGAEVHLIYIQRSVIVL